MLVEKARIYRSLPELSSPSRSYWNIALGDVSGVSEKGSVVSDDVIQYDNNEKRIIMIYALQDEQDWTNPILNYTYPPWYTYSLPVI